MATIRAAIRPGCSCRSRHPEVQAFLAAPIASPAHVYGWICLVGNEGRTFTEDDEHLVMALSGQVGRIYENGYFERAKMRAKSASTRSERSGGVGLRHERDRAQRYLDTAEVILLALDTEGRITLINRKGCSTSSDGPRASCSGATGSRRACRHRDAERRQRREAAHLDRRRSVDRREPRSSPDRARNG